MSNLTIKERKSKFNKISNSLNIKLIKGCKEDIQYMVDYINKGKSFETKLIDLSNKDSCMAYCNELPYGMLSYSSYIDLEEMIIVSSVVKENIYKSKRIVAALRLLKMPLFSGFLKKLRKNNKVLFDDDALGEDLVEYISLDIKKIIYVLIREFKNKLAILNKLISSYRKEEDVLNELDELKADRDGEIKLLKEN